MTPTSKKSAIFDLDGTLALVEHRRHFVTGPGKDWDSFFKACVDDQPNVPVIEMLRMLRYAGHKIHIASGRYEQYRPETMKWFNDNGVWFESLTMRPDGDFTPDEELKRRWLRDGLFGEGNDILCSFDDRDKVVRMWREEGIACFQVAPGNF